MSLIAVCLVFIVNLPVFASVSSVHSRRIRPLNPVLAERIADLEARSPAFQSITSTLEHSNVIVYVTCDPAPTSLIRGHLGFLSATANDRYLVASIRCTAPVPVQIDTLAHELWHATEVARAPSVVDRSSFERLYAAIGFRRDVASATAYDTEDAKAWGRKVKLEWFGWSDDPAPSDGSR